MKYNTMKGLIAFLKEWTLPVAMVFGTVVYLVFRYVPALDAAGDVCSPIIDTLFPMFIFLTLFITFSKVDFHQMKPHRWQFWLLTVQLLLIAANVGIALLVKDNPEQKLLWEGVLTCVIAPCASAAPVVTGKLGGDINTMTAFTLISSILCAITIPAIFPILERAANISFVEASLIILQKLAIVMLLPLLLGWFVQHYVKPLCQWMKRHPDLGFYSWGCSLAITTGVTVKNICNANTSVSILLMIALLSACVCVLHFIIGRRIGKSFNERINCGQGMFQKNTGMAIWVAYMYLNPVASIGAGCYVLWQNIINSYEIWEQREQS